MSNEESLTSIKELASKLKVSDALLKKIIKDFDVEIDRAQKKVFLNAAAATTVREVLALRASGKKNQEIKEMFDAAKKANQEEAQAIEEAQVAEEVPSADIKEVKPERKVRKDKFPVRNNRTKVKKEEIAVEAVITEEIVENIEPRKEEAPRAKKEEELDLSSYLDETDNLDEEISLSLKLAESALSDDGESEDLGDEEPVFEEDDDEDDEEEEAPRHRQASRIDDGRLNPRRIKRRQFSFRYIQRQIANDAKRVHYIKQKLKRGRLSTQETMNLEESLEQRSKLLSGWVHLLRWVKS